MKTQIHARIRRRGGLLAAALVAASASVIAVAQAQERRERPQPSEPPVETPREREGEAEGRRFQPPPQRDGRDQEGTPEGMPRAQIAPPGGEGRPFFLPPGRWMLGVHAYNTSTGVVVTRVAPRSPAARVGLEPHDVIVTVEGFQVGYVGGQLYSLGDELQHRAGPRGRVRLLVQNWRNNELLNLDVRLERDLDYYRPFPRQRE